jgi:predicted transcriptional regulator
MTAEELCRLAAIPPRTYYSHMKTGSFTQAELKRIDKVLHFEDGELIAIIRG